FARAFAARDLALVRPLYDPAVVYVSPTVRLFGWPARIDGLERTLEFVARTVRDVRAIDYRMVEHAIVTGRQAAFVRVPSDSPRSERRPRSEYVVVSRYRDGLIARQELYYDPSAALVEVPPGA